MSLQPDFDEDLDLDRDSLLETISSLREDVSTMKASMRRMLRENLQLRQELGGPVPGREEGVAGLNRVRDEVDLLSRLYEDGGPRRRSLRSPGRGGGDMLRKMMLMMMVSDMF